MAIWKLAEQGPLSMTVMEITEQEGKFGVQYAVDGATADGEEVRLYVSIKGLTSQLARLKLDTESAIGQALYFEQVMKDGTRYTNISRGTGGPSKAAPARTASSATAAGTTVAAVATRPKMTVAEAAKLYGECVDAAMMTLGNKLQEAEVPFDGKDIAAAAATLYISLK